MSDMPDDTHKILTQADALMNRHRSPRVFVAKGVVEESQSLPDTDTPAPVDEDFPVLTEIVSEITIEDSGEKSVPGSGAEPDNIAAMQRQKIEEAMEGWLDSRLPDEVLRVMDGVSDQLIVSLVSRMREELLPELLTAIDTRNQDDHRKQGHSVVPNDKQQPD